MDTETVIKKHRAYPTIEQKCRLVQLVQADKELVLAKFTETFTKKEAARRWQVIAEKLNNISGAVKTWREWRKTWQDRKSRIARERREQMHKVNNPIKSTEKLKTNVSFPEASEPGPSQTEDSGLNIEDIFQEGTAIKMKLESSDSDDPLNSEEEYLLLSDPHTPEPEPEPEIEVPTNPAKPASRRKRYRRVLRRPVTQSRLHLANHHHTNHITVNEVKKALIQKNEIKKKFYAEYMVEIRKQTQALLAIANRLANK